MLYQKYDILLHHDSNSAIAKTTKMTISRNITEAAKTGLKYHVISNNEIHSFNNKKQAKKDLAFGKRVIKNSSNSSEKIELKTLEQIS